MHSYTIQVHITNNMFIGNQLKKKIDITLWLSYNLQFTI